MSILLAQPMFESGDYELGVREVLDFIEELAEMASASTSCVLATAVAQLDASAPHRQWPREDDLAA